ncbi:hypothetical protein [Sinobaca sp. H24]|uniref:hypothetical protein n=1 Tax=Sinobaca sp. H24 TaxID=2923376 RepID=UPI0020792E20|nr:hypothetical protein [Sinobaca sp. H24]
MNAAGVLSSFSGEGDGGEQQNVAVLDNTSEEESMGEALASYEESSFAYENYSGTEEEALTPPQKKRNMLLY